MQFCGDVMIRFFVSLSICLLVSVAANANSQAVLEGANAAQYKGKFEDAIAGYTQYIDGFTAKGAIADYHDLHYAKADTRQNRKELSWVGPYMLGLAYFNRAIAFHHLGSEAQALDDYYRAGQAHPMYTRLDGPFSNLPKEVSDTADAQLCYRFNTVLAGADTFFADMKGKRAKPKSRIYAASFQLPEVFQCKVTEDDDRTRFSCMWDFDSVVELTAGYEDLAASLSACLADRHEDMRSTDWQMGRTTTWAVRKGVTVWLSSLETPGGQTIGGISIAAYHKPENWSW